MNNKILAGLFVVLGLVGIGFAWNGFPGIDAVPEEVPEMVKENMEACREYFTSEEASALRDELQEAREAGDFERMEEIRGQMMENTPEDCRPRMPRHARMMDSLPEDVKEEFREAFENRDFESLMQLKEEYPPPFGHPMGHMNCECGQED